MRFTVNVDVPDLPPGIDFYVRAIHWPRRGTFEVDRLDIVTTTVTGTLELVFACFPVRGTTQMRANRINHE